MNAKDEGQQWHRDVMGIGSDKNPFRVYLAGPNGEHIRFTEGLGAAIPILNALQQRVRVLEEALRDINETVQGHFNGDDLLILRRWLPAILPSPVLPGSTEGGEGS